MEIMEDARDEGVLGHLQMLEMGARGLARQDSEQGDLEQRRMAELRAKIVYLRAQRDQLRAQTETTMKLKNLTDEEVQREGGSTENSQLQLCLLAARRTQLKDLLNAHHLIGGYDLIETKPGKRVCVSLATAYDGISLETYNLEMELGPAVRICRHNVPPSVPLERLAQQNLQTDLRAFLQTLSQHLNGLAGRRQQICHIKQLLGSVKVMESNTLYNILVLLCKVPGEKGASVLCTLEYGDLTRCLPTRVTVDSEDKMLPESPQWRKNQALLLEAPAHTALLAMRKMGSIA